MFSIISVYNNRESFEKNLLKNLKTQNTPFELMNIDNSEGKFNSAASALNWGGRRAKGRYLMFIHQDVVLQGSEWLKKAEDTLDHIPDLGIAGCAGFSRGGELVGFIKDSHCLWGKPIAAPVITQTLDELVLIIPRKVFEKRQFDEKICGWHMYGIDYCLDITKRRLNAYVIPCFVWHNSPATNRQGLLKAKRHILLKYGWKYPNIFATTGVFSWKKYLIDSLVGIVEKLFRYKLSIENVPSLLPAIGTCLDNELMQCYSILSLEYVHPQGFQYYGQEVIFTESLPYFPKREDKKISNYLLSSPEAAVFNVANTVYDGALVSLKILLGNNPDKILSFIEAIEKVTKKKISLQLVTKNPEELKLVNKLKEILETAGFIQRTQRVCERIANLEHTMITFAKNLYAKEQILA